MSAVARVEPETGEVGLPFGQAPDGSLLAIADVPSGLACDCCCPGCGARLVAKKGNVVRHHFAHEADACEHGYETIVHRLAKDIVAAELGIMLPGMEVEYRGLYKSVRPPSWFSLDRVDLEVWKGGFRPDIIGRRGDREIAIEIVVTHACPPEKVALLAQRGMATIEIDLVAFRHSLDPPGLKDAVLRDAPRRWVFNAKLAPHIAELKAQYDATEARLQKWEAKRRAVIMAHDIERIRWIVGQIANAADFDADDYLSHPIPGYGSLEEIASDRILFGSCCAALGAIQSAVLGRSPTLLEPSFDTLELPLERWLQKFKADLQAKAIAIDEENARRAAVETARQQRQADETAKALAKDQAKLAQFRADIEASAIARMGQEWADAWLSIRPWTGAPSIRGMKSAPDEEGKWYWNWLDAEVQKRNKADAAREAARQDVAIAALRHFKSKEMADLWVKAKHPKLGMRSPIDVAPEVGGVDLCLRLLK